MIPRLKAERAEYGTLCTQNRLWLSRRHQLNLSEQRSIHSALD